MTGVLNENMAANHLILISFCSGETANMKAGTCGGKGVKVGPSGGGRA